MRNPIYLIEGTWLPIGEEVVWDGRIFNGVLNTLEAIKYRLVIYDDRGRRGVSKLSYIELVRNQGVPDLFG